MQRNNIASKLVAIQTSEVRPSFLSRLKCAFFAAAEKTAEACCGQELESRNPTPLRKA